MSKVHEALKRAQEGRSLWQQNENPNARTKVEAAPEIDAPVVAAAPVSVGTPVENAPKFVAPVIERKTPAFTVRSDSKPTQFLRFEDLLKSCAKPAWVLDPNTVVFGALNQPMVGTEQFRTLRSRLYSLRETSPLKKVLITSSLAGEGKTFVAANLALAIARERERKVLLIDTDFRCPRLHLILGAPLSPGLSDYLLDQATESEIIQHGQEGNLCFIGAGNRESDPSELLSNGKLEKFLDRIGSLFDWVIIDSPPCLPVADANIVASLSDGVLLVVRAGSTPSAALERARKDLQKRKVVGVVLNAVEEADGYGPYYG
jgi:protein-tyrosine kinase